MPPSEPTPPPAATPAPRPHPVRRVLRGLAAVFVALWIFVEEWLWEGMLAFMGWLGRLPPVRWLEERVRRLPPYPAMAVFLVPMAVLLPAKLLGLWLIGTGRVVAGVLVFVLAKVVGTAIAARLFALTKPALLTIGWFRKLHDWFLRVRDRLFAFVRALKAWQVAKAWAAKVRAACKRLLAAARRFWQSLRTGRRA